jgi:hypothetical protein
MRYCDGSLSDLLDASKYYVQMAIAAIAATLGMISRALRSHRQTRPGEWLMYLGSYR